MANRKPFTYRLRQIVGWLMIVAGGLWGASTGICGILALIGVMETDSFEDRLILCATSLVIAVGSFIILWLGIRLKNSGRGDTADVLAMKKASPAEQKETQQVSDEQRPQGEITLQGALNTFSAEEQQRFQDQEYQYSQDTGRAGLSPEIAAANRGMVLVNGRPVPKEVIARRDEMRDRAAVLLTLETSWGGRAEHGEQTLALTHQGDRYRLKLTSRAWNNAGGRSTLQKNFTECVGELNLTEHSRWTVSGFLFHAETLCGLPGWAAEKLAQEKVFTELFTSPHGGCTEKPGQVYWSNWCSPNMEYRFLWFEKQEHLWHAHSDVRVDGRQIQKDTSLPGAADKDIARCLELDPTMYLHHPDIENWIQRDRCGEVTLYHQIEEKDSTDEHHIIYTIDPRNGALYYYEGFPWNRAAPEEAHPATYAELAQTDPRYTGMTIKNWEKYLPKKVNSAQDPFPKKRKQRSKTARDQNDPFHRARSPYEIAGPHRTSLYGQESDRFLFLSDAHLAGELDWGQQEYFAVDTETWQPFYIITQYDGALVAQTWYHVKEAVKWEEVETYGDPVCKRQLTDRPKGQWKDLVVETKTSADRFRIRWRSHRQYNEDVEIQAKETAFLLIRHHKDPSRAQAEKELPRSMAQDEAAFRDAVRSFGIYKAYIIQRLWAFCVKASKPKNAGKGSGKRAASRTKGTASSESKARSVKTWVNILGKPGDHGDVVRIGFGDGTCYLEITNDGFPYGNGGGFIRTLPDDVVRGKRLDARKFERFYRSVYPGGATIDYHSDPIWIDQPTPGHRSK